MYWLCLLCIPSPISIHPNPGCEHCCLVSQWPHSASSVVMEELLFTAHKDCEKSKHHLFQFKVGKNQHKTLLAKQLPLPLALLTSLLLRGCKDSLIKKLAGLPVPSLTYYLAIWRSQKSSVISGAQGTGFHLSYIGTNLKWLHWSHLRHTAVGKWQQGLSHIAFDWDVTQVVRSFPVTMTFAARKGPFSHVFPNLSLSIFVLLIY